MYSCRFCRRPDIPLYLLQAGADVTLLNVANQTALHFAVKNHVDVALQLILKGAEVNRADKWGHTPLHEAARHSNYEAVCLLLHHDADANAACKQLMTPFMLAVHEDVDIRIQKLLLEYEGDINRTDRSGSNSLLLALEGESQMILEILERGADVNRFTEGRNALDLALRYDDTTFFKKIFEAFDYNVAIASGCYPILFSLLCKTIGNEEWCELLELMLYSKWSEEIVNHYVESYEEVFLSQFIEEFFLRKIPQAKLAPFIALCLSYGVKVYIHNLETAFERFGKGEIFEILMQADIVVNRVRYLSLPLLIADTTTVAAHHLNNSKFIPNRYTTQLHLQHTKILLRFCTATKSFREELQAYVNAMKERYGEKFKESDDFESIIEGIKQRLVPSLQELSRDASRIYISFHFGAGSSMFYSAVKHLSVPEVVKNIIRFETPLNYFL